MSATNAAEEMEEVQHDIRKREDEVRREHSASQGCMNLLSLVDFLTLSFILNQLYLNLEAKSSPSSQKNLTCILFVDRPSSS